MREYGVTIDPSSLSSEQMLIEDGDFAENAGMDGVMSDKDDVRLPHSLLNLKKSDNIARLASPSTQQS